LYGGSRSAKKRQANGAAMPTLQTRRSEYATRQLGDTYCGRILRVRDTRDEPAHHSLLAPGGPPPFLQVTGISKTYGRQTALRDVSFVVAPGEIVGLVGPNGAGKSTTLRIICGLLRPDSGGVRIDGIDQRKEPARFRSRLGALIEAPACYPSLTAFDHLAYLARIRGCHDRSELERVLTNVGLPPRSKKTVRQFSLGMKQRLGIAMAILDSPGLVTASFRRTTASGMVTAMIAFIGLVVMSMLPFHVVPPRFVFVR